jgi:hypothetical protein
MVAQSRAVARQLRHFSRPGASMEMGPPALENVRYVPEFRAKKLNRDNGVTYGHPASNSDTFVFSWRQFCSLLSAHASVSLPRTPVPQSKALPAGIAQLSVCRSNQP